MRNHVNTLNIMKITKATMNLYTYPVSMSHYFVSLWTRVAITRLVQYSVVGQRASPLKRIELLSCHHSQCGQQVPSTTDNPYVQAKGVRRYL